jgi:hypothetical protein
VGFQRFKRYDPDTGVVEDLTWLNQALNPELDNTFFRQLPNQPDTMLISSAGQLWVYFEKEQKVT